MKKHTSYLVVGKEGRLPLEALRAGVAGPEKAPSSFFSLGRTPDDRDTAALGRGSTPTVHLAASGYNSPQGEAVRLALGIPKETVSTTPTVHLASSNFTTGVCGKADRLATEGAPSSFLAMQAKSGGNSPEKVSEAVSLASDTIPELNLLCSFHYFRRVNIADKVIARFPGVKVRVFADSGGFSAMSLGKKIRLTDYAKWLHENEDSLAIYANLDAIGDPETTKRNQAVLEKEGLAPIPVFHVGSDFKYLDEMLERYHYIALGGMVPYIKSQRKQLGRWVYEVFVRITTHNPHGIKVHGFGLGTSWELCKSFPWYSIDASSWTSAFQFRHVDLFDNTRGEFVKIALGTDRGHDVWKHQTLLRSYGFAPTDFYPTERFSYVKAGALSVMSVLRAERWLRTRRETTSSFFSLGQTALTGPRGATSRDASAQRAGVLGNKCKSTT